MRILIPILAFSSAGGMRVLSKLADALIDEGHDVEFLASHLINKPYYPTKAKIVMFKNMVSSVPFVRGLFNLWGMFVYMLRHQSSYDVILSNYNLTAFPVCLSTLCNRKGYYYIQAYEPEFYNKKTVIGMAGYTMACLSYSLPLKKIVNGSIYKDYKFLQAIDVVEPGIDLENFKYIPKKREAGVVYLGCVGRELKWKGTLEIILAVEQVRARTGLNLILNIAFEMPVGIAPTDYEFVRFHRPHGDALLASFYRESELFIATGLLQDGAFHYPCLEAMASGCVVISNYGPANESNSLFIHSVTCEKIISQILRYLEFTEGEIESFRMRGLATVQDYSWAQTARKMSGFLSNPSK